MLPEVHLWWCFQKDLRQFFWQLVLGFLPQTHHRYSRGRTFSYLPHSTAPCWSCSLPEPVLPRSPLISQSGWVGGRDVCVERVSRGSCWITWNRFGVEPKLVEDFNRICKLTGWCWKKSFQDKITFKSYILFWISAWERQKYIHTHTEVYRYMWAGKKKNLNLRKEASKNKGRMERREGSELERSSYKCMNRLKRFLF